MGLLRTHQEDELKDGSHEVQLGLLGGLYQMPSQAST